MKPVPVKSETLRTALKGRQEPNLDFRTNLKSAQIPYEIALFKKGETIFSQGDICKNLFYVQKGNIRLSAISGSGKRIIVSTLKLGDFLGIGILGGQPTHMMTATAGSPVTLLKIDTAKISRILREGNVVSRILVDYLVKSIVTLRGDIIHIFFNTGEKRLARILLLLAQLGVEGVPKGTVPRTSQETLAEMIGVTRNRVNHFMIRFRKLDFIEYDNKGNIKVNEKLKNVFL